MEISVLQDFAAFYGFHLIEKRHAGPNWAFCKELYGNQSEIVRSRGLACCLQFLEQFLVDDIPSIFHWLRWLVRDLA